MASQAGRGGTDRAPTTIADFNNRELIVLQWICIHRRPNGSAVSAAIAQGHHRHTQKGSAEEGPAAATYWRVPFGVSPSISLMFLGAQEETPAELRSLAMSPINNKL